MSKERIYEVERVTITCIEKEPPKYRIEVHGKTRSAGWSDPQLSAVVFIEDPPDGIYDFNFIAEPPSSVSAQVFTSISVHDVLGKISSGFRGVRVHATSNTEEAILEGS